MNIVRRINENLEKLPLTLQSEVLDFVEYMRFKSKSQSHLIESVVQITPDVCFGKPRIRNTRIPVWLLVSFRNQGASDQELLHNYPSLSLNNLQAIWDYYNSHKEEIDHEIAYQHNYD